MDAYYSSEHKGFKRMTVVSLSMANCARTFRFREMIFVDY